MTSDNWQRAKNIFNSALDLDVRERPKYLLAACEGDEVLRQKVEDLLSSYESDFMEGQPVTRAEGKHDRLPTGAMLGRYEIIRLLDAGGMGEVYLAKDTSLDRHVCLKVLSLAAPDTRRLIDRFVREAQSASALNHAHICTIYEIDRDHDPPYIAMEYIDGETLAETIRKGNVDAKHAVSIALQIADGIAEAHDAGILHRDIKPANIILTKRGGVKIVDFGLAKRITADLEVKTQEQLSVSGTIMGTVSYMSPEQIKGEKVDLRSDIFSFGVLLFEMFAGRRPFDGNSTAETMALILTANPVPLSSNSTSQLETLINRCLEKDKEQRFQSMKEVIAALQEIAPNNLDRSFTPDQESATVKLPPAQTGRGTARSLYLRGKVKAASENREEVDGAIRLLEEAVELEPNFAEAYAALALAYTTKAFQFASDAEKKQLSENAEVAVETALSLRPNLAEGHFARGVILWTLAKRFPHDQAIQAYTRAIELDPNLSEAHHRLGLIYFHVGLLDQAREEIKKALKINPNNTMARFRMGTVEAHRGKFEDALAIFKTIPRDVSPSIVDRAMADALVNLGRLEEAEVLVEEYLERYPADEGGNVTSVKAVLLAKAGKRAEAEAAIRHAVEVGRGFGHFHHTAVNIAAAYAVLGETDDAVRWLRDAVDNGFPCYPYFEVNPNFDNIRSSVGFVTLMSEIKRAWERRSDELFPILQTTHGRGVTRTTSGLSTARLLLSRRKITAALVVLLITGLTILGWLVFGRTPVSRIDSLAVMPFMNQTGDPDSDYLSDGMTETLIGRLSQIPDLSVMARSTVFRYKGRDISAKEIGKDLKVPAVLTGRVSRRGDQFNLYVELIDADSEKLIWDAEYNRPGSSLATIPGEIARDVANNLKQKLSRADEQRITRNYTENSAAYELYLKGRYYWDKRNEESYNIAEDAYKQAIALDPNYALAYAGLADCFLFSEARGTGRRETMPLAKQYALKALAIDENLAEAHTTLAFVNENFDFDAPAAESGFKRAIELKPNYPVAHQFYGGFLMQTGHTEEGLAEARRAVELEPYSVAMNWYLGMLLEFARRYDEAIAQQKKTLQMQPDYPLAEGNLAGLYVLTGKYADATALIQKGLRAEEQGDRSLLAIVYIRTGRQKDARKILSEMVDRCKNECGNTAYGIGKVYAALGEKDEAMRWLNVGYDRRVFNMFFLRVDPFFDGLRGDPRYEELIRQIGLQS